MTKRMVDTIKITHHLQDGSVTDDIENIELDMESPIIKEVSIIVKNHFNKEELNVG